MNDSTKKGGPQNVGGVKIVYPACSGGKGGGSLGFACWVRRNQRGFPVIGLIWKFTRLRTP